MKTYPVISLLLFICLQCAASNQYIGHWNKGRGYIPFHHITPDGILLSNKSAKPLLDSIAVDSPDIMSDDNNSNFRLSFRIDNRHAHPSRRYTYIDPSGTISYRKNPSWGVFMTGHDGRRCWITIEKGEELPSDYSDAALTGTLVAVSLDSYPESGVADNKEKSMLYSGLGSKTDNKNKDVVINILTSGTVKENILPFSGESLWNIEYKGGVLNVSAGSHGIKQVLSFPIDFGNIVSFGFAASPAAEILVSDISLNITSATPIRASADISQLDRIFEDTEDPLEGYWEIFDRTLDESLLKLGGDYKLAIVRNRDNERYEIIYLGGARINGAVWKTGMLKGILTPSSFPGLLNLEWIDSEGEKLSNSITAQTGYNSTLTLQFPYHSSVIRLRKVTDETD